LIKIKNNLRTIPASAGKQHFKFSNKEQIFAVYVVYKIAASAEQLAKPRFASYAYSRTAAAAPRLASISKTSLCTGT